MPAWDNDPIVSEARPAWADDPVVDDQPAWMADPVVGEQATWGETVKAIPQQAVGGAQQSVGGMAQAAAAPPTLDPAIMRTPLPLMPVIAAPTIAKKIAHTIMGDDAVGAIGQFGRETYAAGTKRIKEATPENQSFWQKAVSTAGVSAGTMLPAGAAAFILRQPGLMAGTFGVQEFGRAFGDAKAQGLGDVDAMRHATASGILEAGTEYLPAKTLFKAGTGPFKRLVNFMAKELPGENIAELGQMVSERVNGLDDEITAQEVLDTVKLTSASTLLTGGAQSLIASALDRKKKTDEEKDAETITRITSAPDIDSAIDAATQSLDTALAEDLEPEADLEQQLAAVEQAETPAQPTAAQPDSLYMENDLALAQQELASQKPVKPPTATAAATRAKQDVAQFRADDALNQQIQQDVDQFRQQQEPVRLQPDPRTYTQFGQEQRRDVARQDRGARRQFQQPLAYLEQRHREKVAETMAEAGLSQAQAEAVNKKFAPKVETDKTTGYYEKRNFEPSIKRAQQHSAETGEEAHYAEVDMANMGGGNKFYGGSTVKFDREFYTPWAAMLRQEVESTGGDVIPVRQGGDELGFVVVNTTEEQLEAALQRAAEKTVQMARERGMGDIKHKSNPDSPMRGINLYFGVTPILQGKTAEQIREVADSKVGLNKAERNENVGRIQAQTAGAVASEGQTGRAEAGTQAPGGPVRAETGQAAGQERQAGVDRDQGLNGLPLPKADTNGRSYGDGGGAIELRQGENADERADQRGLRESRGTGENLQTAGQVNEQRVSVSSQGKIPSKDDTRSEQTTEAVRPTGEGDNAGDRQPDRGRKKAAESDLLADLDSGNESTETPAKGVYSIRKPKGPPRFFTAKQASDKGYISNVSEINEFNQLIKAMHANGREFDGETIAELREINQEKTDAQEKTGQTTKLLANAGQQRLFIVRGDQKFAVESLEDASRKWNEFRKQSGGGASDVGGAKIVDQDGKDVARISYNGRIWPPGERTPDTKPLVEAANEAATLPQNDLPEPSDAQREAGNFKKGHVRVNGLDISIENPAGSKRRPEWPALKNHYGYIRGTVGKDKDHIDVFLTDQAADESRQVFVVDQVKEDGSYDEAKVMLGFPDEKSARAGYLSNYQKGWKGLGAITEMPLADFKEWLNSGNTKKPVGELSKPESVKEPAKSKATEKKSSKRDKPEYSKHSTVEGKPAGMPVAEVQKIVDEFASSLNSPVKYTVVKTQDEAFGDMPERVKGAYYAKDGEIIIVAENAENRQDVIKTLRNETLGRYGLDILPNRAEVIAKIEQTRDVDAFKKYWTSVDRDYAGETDERKAAVVFNRIAEDPMGRLHRVWNEILELIQQGLRKLGMLKAPITKTELRNLAESIADNIRRGDQAASVDEQPAFSKTAGKDQTDTKAFRDWFGESAVVDENGDPLVVYHGTADNFDVFDLNQVGKHQYSDWGKGIYLETSKSGADYYRTEAVKKGSDAYNQAYAEYERLAANTKSVNGAPQYSDESRAALKEFQRIGRELDETKEGKVLALYASIQNPFIQEYSHMPDPYLAERVKAKGHDGIFVLDGNGNIDEIVAFRPEQIKSAIGNRGTFDPNDPNILFSKSVQTEFSEENRRLREENKTVWNRAKKYYRRNFMPGGLLPKDVFAEKIKRDSEIEVVEFDINHLVGSLENIVKQEYGKPFEKMDRPTVLKLNRAMVGKIDPDIKPRTLEAIVAMRQYIDSLSRDYVSILQQQADALSEDFDASERELYQAFRKMTEVVPASDSPADKGKATKEKNRLLDEAKAKAKEIWGDGKKMQNSLSKVAQAAERASLIETITNNIGTYAHRSYKAFDDKDWYKKIPDSVLNGARKYLIDQYVENGETKEEAARLAEVTLHEMTKNGTAYSSMDSFIRESKLGAKDLSVLKKRKQIAPEIRALLGEYIDPRVNFAKSATKMGRLVWNQRFLDRLRETGMGTFLFEGKDRPPEATVQIAGDGSDVYAPLNGLWTFPEIDQAFKDALAKEKMADWYRVIVQLNGLVKYGKTVLSPTTAARNWQSAMFFALANGHFDMRHMAKSVAGLKEYFTSGGDKARLDYLRKLKKLGVVYDTPYAGEMMRLLEDSRIEDMMKSKAGAPYKAFRSMNKFATKAYQYGDDFWKIIGFENEKAALIGAGMKEAEAEKEAAERIRNTYPTYSMVGKAINWLRRFPLVGTFVSFPAEIIRTQGNILRYIHKDWTEGRKKLALRRAAGQAFAAGAIYGLAAISKAMFGVDDEEEEAVRLMAAPWERNSNLLFTGRDENGQLQYIDLSFLDPYNYFKRPLTAILRDQPWEDSAADVFVETLKPFLGADIAAQSIFEVMANKKDTGQPVYNEFGTPTEITLKIANHLRKDLQPGIASNIERTWKAMSGERSSSGRAYDLGDELFGWAGWRVRTLEPKTALYYRSFEFGDAKVEATKTLSGVLRDPNKVTDSEIRSAYQSAQRQQAEAYREMSLIVQAAKKNGLTDQDIRKVLKSSNLSDKDIRLLLKGKVPPLELSRQSLNNATRKAKAIFDDETAKEIRRRYRTANQMNRDQ